MLFLARFLLMALINGILWLNSIMFHTISTKETVDYHISFDFNNLYNSVLIKILVYSFRLECIL